MSWCRVCGQGASWSKDCAGPHPMAHVEGYGGDELGDGTDWKGFHCLGAGLQSGLPIAAPTRNTLWPHISPAPLPLASATSLLPCSLLVTNRSPVITCSFALYPALRAGGAAG